jgi:hypothetical protein
VGGGWNWLKIMCSCWFCAITGVEFLGSFTGELRDFMWVIALRARTHTHTHTHTHKIQFSGQLHRLLVESPLSQCFVVVVVIQTIICEAALKTILCVYMRGFN